MAVEEEEAAYRGPPPEELEREAAEAPSKNITADGLVFRLPNVASVNIMPLSPKTDL